MHIFHYSIVFLPRQNTSKTVSGQLLPRKSQKVLEGPDYRFNCIVKQNDKDSHCLGTSYRCTVEVHVLNLLNKNLHCKLIFSRVSHYSLKNSILPLFAFIIVCVSSLVSEYISCVYVEYSFSTLFVLSHFLSRVVSTMMRV